MKTEHQAARTISLAAGQVIAARPARGTRIVVESGRAWLTVERDGRDFVLTTGRQFTCEADNALVVVEMLDAGALTLAPGNPVPRPAITQRLDCTSPWPATANALQA
jgi:hypothetical protein